MLHQDTSPRTLGLARIWVYGAWLVYFFTVDLTRIATFPDLDVIGPLRILPGEAWEAMCRPAALLLLQAITMGCLGALILGVGPYRRLGIATAVLLMIIQGLVRGYGIYNHAELPLLYAAFILPLFPADQSFALGRRKPSTMAPAPSAAPAALVSIALVLCLTYSFVGAKRIAGGPEVFVDGSVVRMIGARALAQDTGAVLLANEVLHVAWVKWLLLASFPLVTLFEAASLLVLFYPRFRRLWLAVIVSFHVATALVMGIWFPENVVLLAFFLTDLPRTMLATMDRFRTSRQESPPMRPVGAEVPNLVRKAA